MRIFKRAKKQQPVKPDQRERERLLAQNDAARGPQEKRTGYMKPRLP